VLVEIDPANGTRRTVEAEQRVDAAHVTRVVEVDGPSRVEPELPHELVVHRALHVDPAEVRHILERGA
jgi:hypothetical protein